VNGYVLNTITPETDKTCLYFWAFARNYCLGEQRLTHELREGVATIFREDELILEAQQQAIDEHPGYSFYNLNIDAGSMWMRKLIDKMIAAETNGPATSRVIPLRPAACWALHRAPRTTRPRPTCRRPSRRSWRCAS
jgi:vanillate O-demethylase monooxygenase subunit